MTQVASALVYLVDDDATVREGFDSLLRSVGYDVKPFSSAEEFLACHRSPQPSCLLLDVRLPGRSGLSLQETLHQNGDGIPIIFITAYGDVPLSVRAMKAGAVDFSLKPCHEQTLLDSVGIGIERDWQLRQAAAEADHLQELFQKLSPREAEVIALVADGLSNKEVASQLSTSENTISARRSSAMRKLECRRVGELINKIRKLPP